jgi:DNA helicase-2/ATP-dependent DNA helicase PcrA
MTGGDGAPPANLCAIGDPDQAIYGFRGADRRYFLRFQSDYPGAQVLHLEQNYRSSPMILAAASQVIAGNHSEERLRIWTDYLDQTRVDIHAAPTDKAEAEYVVHQIEQMVGGTSLFSLDSGRTEGTGEHNRAFGEFAVLYRTSAQSHALVEAFERSGIPFQAVGQTPLLEYKEIRELMALLHLAHSPERELYRQAVFDGVGKGAATNAQRLLGALPGGSLSVAELIERSERLMLETLHRQLNQRQRERIAQLRRRATLFGANLLDFLTAMALQREADLYDPRADRVALMTLHAAKGLEFPVVFMVGCEEGLLPYHRPDRPSDVEEERRLFFVGMTRAQRRLVLSYAQNRFLFGERMQNPPSRFLNDIEQTLKEISSMAQRQAKRAEPALRQLDLFA